MNNLQKPNKERQAGGGIKPHVSRIQFKPILFSTPMVEAIEAGRKTQTRRLVKFPKDFTGEVYNNAPYGLKYSSNLYGDTVQRLAYALPDDILWVRETWQETTWLHPSDENYGYIYKASENGREWAANDESWIWKPSLFMPKEACRLFLKVISCSVERLQDISHEDAVAEGIEYIDIEEPFTMGYKLYGKHRIPDLLGRKAVTGTSIESYQTLWESINGRESWDSNPYVWVVSFELTERPQGFC